MAGNETVKKKPCGCGGKPVLHAKITIKNGAAPGKAASNSAAVNKINKRPWYHRFLERMKSLF